MEQCQWKNASIYPGTRTQSDLMTRIIAKATFEPHDTIKNVPKQTTYIMTINQNDKTISIFNRNLCETESVKGIWQVRLFGRVSKFSAL